MNTESNIELSKRLAELRDHETQPIQKWSQPTGRIRRDNSSQYFIKYASMSRQGQIEIYPGSPKDASYMFYNTPSTVYDTQRCARPPLDASAPGAIGYIPQKVTAKSNPPAPDTPSPLLISQLKPEHT